jgi:mannitol-1-/sugar-/sorbitol-6-phosphatase
VRVILCDLDGVLVDSTAAVVGAWRWWAKNHDIDVARVEALMHGRPSTEVVRLVAPALDAVAEAASIEAHEAAT